MNSLKGKGIKNIIIFILAIIIVFIMLSQVAFSSVDGASITSKTTMCKSANVNDITPFINAGSSNAGYVIYTLFLNNNTLLKGNVMVNRTGVAPYAIAYDSANNYIYVANSNSSNVSVINGATNSVIARISVWSGEDGMAYDSVNNYIYIANGGSNNVSVINGVTNTVIANIFVGALPEGVAYDPSNNYVYVGHGAYPQTLGLSILVFVINCASNTVIANISVGSRGWPDAIAYDSSNNYVYVANGGSNNVSVINGATNAVIASISVGSEPYAIAYDSGNNYIYVCNGDNVSVINGATNSVIASISVGSEPYAVAYDPSNNYIYVANFDSGSISIISTYENPYSLLIGVIAIVIVVALMTIGFVMGIRKIKGRY
jgi:YVTN family beta-propeller protein